MPQGAPGMTTYLPQFPQPEPRGGKSCACNALAQSLWLDLSTRGRQRTFISGIRHLLLQIA